MLLQTMGISISHSTNKGNMGHTQEVLIYSVCLQPRLFEKEVKKEKQLVVGFNRFAQAFTLLLWAVGRHSAFWIRGETSRARWEWV